MECAGDGDGEEEPDPLPETSLIGYVFLDGDDAVCRENFIEVERIYMGLDKEEATEVLEEKNVLL